MSGHYWHRLTEVYSWCSRCGTVCVEHDAGQSWWPMGKVRREVDEPPPCVDERPYLAQALHAEEVDRWSLDRVRELVERPSTLGKTWGPSPIADVVTKMLGDRQHMIDLMALKYGRGLQLVKRRDGDKTTWAIEPHCDGCVFHGPGYCKNPGRKDGGDLDGHVAPDWCPRRYDDRK